MMKRTLVTAALAAVVGLPAHAAIAPGSSGNGELFFTIHDPDAKISYTLDLGLRMNDFIGSDGAPNGTGIGSGRGVSLVWSVQTDPAWADFLNQIDYAKLAWAVIAIDSTGNNQPHSQRLLTTVRSDQEDRVGGWTNLNFSNGIGGAQGGRFFDSINNTGTHVPQFDYSVNGSSVNAAPSNAYFGQILTPSYNGGAPFFSTNRIGDTSFAFYVTRSSTSNLATARVLSERFGNDIGFGVFAFDGQTVSYTTPIPEPGSYALMALGLAGLGGWLRRRQRG